MSVRFRITVVEMTPDVAPNPAEHTSEQGAVVRSFDLLRDE